MSFLHELLNYYHLTIKDLDAKKASGSFLSLKNPFDLPDFKKVIERINQAIAKKEKVVLYGDYDVDGLTSVAILKLALEEKGLNTAFFIPSRYKEGYGLNIDRVNEMADKGYQLIICLDNGITAFEAIKQAKNRHMDVIVIDHHENKETIPECDCYFHQTLSNFLDYNCSAASLSFFIASYLLSRYDAYYATLAGIAVFSDVMPLVGNNLILAKMMLKFVNKYHYANLSYLLGNGKISYEDVSFRLISPLNAVGRVMKDSLSTNNACRFLLEKNNLEIIKRLGSKIVSANTFKKELVKTVKFVSDKTMESDHCITLVVGDYFGLAGLFANQVMNEKNIPVAVFAKGNEEGTLIGSIRAPEKYVVDIMLSKYPYLFISGGGHKQAFGCTIKEKDYLLFCTMFASECAKQALENKDEEKPYISLTLEDLNEINYSILEDFMPFGNGFEAPYFQISVEKARFNVFGTNKDTLIAKSDDKKGKVVIFKADSHLLDDKDGYLEVYGSMSKETFNGFDTISIVSKKVVSH